MQVIKCTAGDAQSVGNFYDDVVLYLTQHINYPRWMYKNYPSHQTVAEAIACGTQYACLDENGAVVGAFVLNADPAGSYEVGKWSKPIAQGDYLVIHSFATHYNLYHRGIAAQMLDFCLRQAQSMGAQAIRLDVVPDNYPARAFYEKHGFAYVGEEDLNRGYKHIPTFCLYELNF